MSGKFHNCQLPGSPARDIITVQFTHFRGRLFIVGLSTRGPLLMMGGRAPSPQASTAPQRLAPRALPKGMSDGKVTDCLGEGSGTDPWERLRARVSSYRKPGHGFFPTSWPTHWPTPRQPGSLWGPGRLGLCATWASVSSAVQEANANGAAPMGLVGSSGME